MDTHHTQSRRPVNAWAPADILAAGQSLPPASPSSPSIPLSPVFLPYYSTPPALSTLPCSLHCVLHCPSFPLFHAPTMAIGQHVVRMSASPSLRQNRLAHRRTSPFACKNSLQGRQVHYCEASNGRGWSSVQIISLLSPKRLYFLLGLLLVCLSVC